MDIQRPLPDLQRAHSNSASAAIMVSPISPPSDSPEHSDNAEDETCRICKSEATPDQPLFYPCKCSGSIKYVHQDCLMEWLERSQKKHCELCKTPFRFTKLYERNMPQKLPMGLFVKHLLLHAVGTTRTWARSVLVGVVWLVVLPWVMRHVWAVLFYFADGGWWMHPRDEPHPALGAAINASHAAFENYAMCSPSLLHASQNIRQTSYVRIFAPLNTIWTLLMDQAHNNATFADISYHGVLRALFYPAAFDSFGLTPDTRTNEAITLDYPVRPPPMIFPQNADSILSRFPILQNLTKSQSINRLIITILEGQIMTILVVICFILVFLIREWVVQQQPGINVGAGFEAQFPPPGREEEEEAEAARRRPIDEQMEELQRMIALVEEQQGQRGRGAIERGAREGVRPPTPPIARRDTEDEVQRAEWREQEQQARDNGMHFRRRVDSPNRLPPAAEGVDENGDPIPVIGVTRVPTTEYGLRGRSEQEKRKIVHGKLYEHIRFCIPGIAGLATHLMMEEGVDQVLKYIDYEEEIHQHLTFVLLEYNQKLVDEGRRPPILTKEAGKGNILEALVSLLAEDHKARRLDTVVTVFMELELPTLLDILGDPKIAEKMVRDLDKWEGPGPGEETAEWAKRHMDTSTFLTDAEQPGVLEDWEDEESIDEDDTTEREKAYRESVRARRASRSSSVYDESEEEDPYSASRPDGGLAPERRRWEAKLAAKANAQVPDKLEEKPFTFSFRGPDIDLDNSEAQDLRTDPAGPSGSEETQPESRPSQVSGGLLTPPTPSEEIEDGEREVTPEDRANGVVGYTVNGRQLISNEEVMRRIGANENDDADDEEGGASDNEDTAYTQDQDTQDDSGIATELRTPEEIAETARLEAVAEAARVEAARPQTLGAKLAFWLWGDAEAEDADAGADDEHIVDDIDAEAPFVPVNHGHHEHHDHRHEHDHEDDEDEVPPLAPALAGFGDDLDNMDPEAIDEAEDFDGIMELIGMRGPVFTLMQNCLIGIILLTITIFLGVWIPYIVGKIILLLAANPISAIKLPLRLIFKAAAVMQDLALIFFGGCYYTLIKGISFLLSLVGMRKDFLAEKNSGIIGLGAIDAVMYAGTALERIITDFVMMFAPDSELPYFSAAAHESLLSLRSLIGSIFNISGIFECARDTITEHGVKTALWMALFHTKVLAIASLSSSLNWLIHLPALLAKPETWVITLSSPPRQQALDMALSHWNALDRTYAILAGYGTFISLGAAYISKGSPFSTSTTGREWEALIIDMLHQAGGVLKVILIISIEMLVFPLYCGLLLDIATLPLFEGATLMSRLTFGMTSPFTSMFVHWFVGTCYMFHFALFVSMCRKILRKGTLYFIRDPDDPTFHPVRDVLERNVYTQLKKIGFSAAVYGALVLVCLGGVVWSLSGIAKGVLPIRWSSNEPVLEFPIDLLFYNFLMPCAVRYFRPARGLHALYKWWFVQSAHYLRLSHFLLGDRRLEEELWPAPTNTGGKTLGEMSKDELREIIEAQAIIPPDAALPTGPEIARREEVQREWLNRGRYVRAPASDMVRIPKEKSFLLEVNARNERLDGLPEVGDELHGRMNKQMMMVYNPPKFWSRVILFVVALWAFAAVTGCSATLVPLVIGRRIFAWVLPAEVERNDVYAFAMGANLMVGTLYGAYYLRTTATRAYHSLLASDPLSFLTTTLSTTLKITKLVYTYLAFIGLIPALLAMLMEFYIILPLHSFVIPGEQHTVHFIQSWTLGLLMVNIGRRWVLSEEWGIGESRAAVALRRVVRRGYGDLDVGLATRGFILPIVLAGATALAAPVAGAGVAVRIGILEESVKLYRNAYPFSMGLALLVVGIITAMKKLGQWRTSVRDEVYLIGERLHNFNPKGRRERRMVGRRIET